MINPLTSSIIVMGVATVVLSVHVAFHFYSQSKRLGGDGRRLTNGLMFQLLGESLLGLGTLSFAVAAHLDMLPHFSSFTASSIRFLMFFASSATTIHLYNVTTRMNSNHGDS